MVAPMEPMVKTFFFQMGYQVENYYTRGCLKKSAAFSPPVRAQRLFFLNFKTTFGGQKVQEKKNKIT